MLARTPAVQPNGLGWSFRLGMALLLPALGCTLDDRVLGNDTAAFVDSPKIDFDYGPLEPNGCDLSGIWIAEQEALNSALGTGLVIARNWYYYEIESDGERFTITRGWDCGFETTGMSTVGLFPPTKAALSLRNRQEGALDASEESGPRVAPRTGIYRPARQAGNCEFSMERWWWVRGARLSYLPDRSEYGSLDIADMEARAPLPTKRKPQGEEDWDGDGKPGFTIEVFKPLRGQRHVVQRDWNEIEGFIVPDGANRFIGPISFNNQESVIEASSAILASGSTPRDEGHTIRFLRIDEKAPTDTEEFVAFCEEKIAPAFVAMRDGERVE